MRNVTTSFFPFKMSSKGKSPLTAMNEVLSEQVNGGNLPLAMTAVATNEGQGLVVVSVSITSILAMFATGEDIDGDDDETPEEFTGEGEAIDVDIPDVPQEAETLGEPEIQTENPA